jgi:hypothetical protein
MTNRFMISVAAAALIAGTGFASAQGTGPGRDAPAGSTVQQSAPSSERGNSAAPTSPSSGMKATQSEEKSPGAAKNQRADDKDKAQGPKSKSMSSENEGAKGGKDMKAEGREGSKMNNAQSKDGMSKDSAQSKDGMSKDGRPSGTNSAQDTKSGSSTTTGNAATSATAAPPPEKQTQIVSAIRQEKVEETTNVNFNISVGTTVPSSVRFYPLSSRIVEIYPEWRGYDFILVHGRYIILRPRTHEIVYIIEG